MIVAKRRTTASLMLKAAIATVVLILAGTGVTISQSSITTSNLPDFEVALLVDKNGKVIPVAKDGTRIARCGRVGRKKSRCKVLNKKSDVETIRNLALLKYRLNPSCYLFVIDKHHFEYCS